jgi:Flp pilus assembly protein TadG
VNILRALRRDDGATAIIVAALIVVFIALAAMVVDVGAVYQTRRSLQTAADAAALAAVAPLTPSPGKPSDHARAQAMAEQYVALNGGGTATITFGTTYVSGSTPALRDGRLLLASAELVPCCGGGTGGGSGGFQSYDTINVTVSRNVSFTFAGVMGIRQSTVTAHASAVAESPTSYSARVFPFGVLKDDAEKLQYGDTLTLKAGGGGGSTGNFGLVALGGANSTPELAAIVAGGGTSAAVGDAPGLAQGNKVPVITAMKSWVTCSDTLDRVVGPPDPENGVVSFKDVGESGGMCHRIIVCPVLDLTAWPNGNSTKSAYIVGCAYFFVTQVTNDSVTAQFIRPLQPKAPGYGPPMAYSAVRYRLVH